MKLPGDVVTWLPNKDGPLELGAPPGGCGGRTERGASRIVS